MPGYGKTIDDVTRRSEARQAARKLPRPEIPRGNIRRRQRLAKEPAKWLRYYFPGIFRLPFGKVHNEIIEAVNYTIKTGGRCVVAGPRGTGKSYLLDGMALLAVVQKQARFPVVIPWDAKGLKKALGFWQKALCFNEKFSKDYADFCHPFVACRGSSQKCLTLLDDDGRPYGARLLVSEGLIVLPDSLGVIGGSTMNGNPLGLHHTTDKGEGLRPDCVLIDDPQDAETAQSATQIQNTIDLVDKDISGMAGPDTPMPMMMACTVKQRGDVAEHYLDPKSGWRAVRVAQIERWPENMALWEEWHKAYEAGEENKDGGKAGLAFYKTHKDELIKGMVVSWDHRYSKGQPDAYYSAMFDYFRMGKSAFMAERQGDPLDAIASQYELTSDIVIKHTVTIPRLTLPPSSTVFTGHCDINRAGLHWCLSAFDQQMTGHCVAYGKTPQHGELWEKNAPELDRKQAIFRGLKAVCDAIAQTRFIGPVRLGLFLIDLGYERDVVMRFCNQARYPFRVLPSGGRAAQKYYVSKNKLVGRPFENCHVEKTIDGTGHYLIFNSDYWRETAQRAFLAEVAAPGGYTIHHADDPYRHKNFADQICAEKLSNKYDTDQGLRWEWRHAPGTHWDYGDALTGSWVAAAACGLSASGMPVTRKRYVETRKAKVTVE